MTIKTAIAGFSAAIIIIGAIGAANAEARASASSQKTPAFTTDLSAGKHGKPKKGDGQKYKGNKKYKAGGQNYKYGGQKYKGSKKYKAGGQNYKYGGQKYKGNKKYKYGGTKYKYKYGRMHGLSRGHGKFIIRGRNFSTWRGGRYRVYYGNRWVTFVPLGALAAILVGGDRYYPYAYISAPEDYCEGVTEDGCELRWREVETIGGGLVGQCVAYCPWED